MPLGAPQGPIVGTRGDVSAAWHQYFVALGTEVRRLALAVEALQAQDVVLVDRLDTVDTQVADLDARVTALEP